MCCSISELPSSPATPKRRWFQPLARCLKLPQFLIIKVPKSLLSDGSVMWLIVNFTVPKLYHRKLSESLIMDRWLGDSLALSVLLSWERASFIYWPSRRTAAQGERSGSSKCSWKLKRPVINEPVTSESTESTNVLESGTLSVKPNSRTECFWGRFALRNYWGYLYSETAECQMRLFRKSLNVMDVELVKLSYRGCCKLVASTVAGRRVSDCRRIH